MDAAHAPVLSNELRAQREEFYRDLNAHHSEALWNALGSIAQTEPRVASLPFIWQWREIRPKVLRSGDLVTAQEAERRMLMLINPAYETKSLRTVGCIYAGLQMVLPGEVADAHRHTPSAQRFVIEGSQAYTNVNGERTMMARGDYVTTPRLAWHDHGNLSDGPVIWLDGLNIPFVNILDANFFEDYPSPEPQPVLRQDEDSVYRWSRNLRPTWEAPQPDHTPVLNYRWATTRDTLHRLRDEAGSSYDGILLEYSKPLNGRSTLPTMSAYLQLLRKGEHTRAHRHTASTIYHVAEGGGHSTVGGQRIAWEEGDTFTVPSWAPRARERGGRGGALLLLGPADPLRLRPAAGSGLRRPVLAACRAWVGCQWDSWVVDQVASRRR